ERALGDYVTLQLLIHGQQFWPCARQIGTLDGFGEGSLGGLPGAPWGDMRRLAQRNLPDEQGRNQCHQQDWHPGQEHGVQRVRQSVTDADGYGAWQMSELGRIEK